MMEPSVDIADRTTATSALDDELEAELTSSRAKPRPSSTTSRSSSGRGTHVTSQGPRTSTTSSTTHRNSVFGRMSSGIGGKNPLRDTFFKSKSDPLDESSQNEFNLTIIDEEGLISKNKHEHDSTNADANSSSAASSSSGHSSTASYIVVGIAVVTVLFTYIATLLSPTLDGYEIDPGLVLGSLQTLLLCTVVVITYNGVQVFQAHPNPLIMYKCVIDIILAMRFLLDPWLLRVGVYQVGKRESCAYLSGFTQFLYFSSDCWYFAMILDLHKSLTNPFTSVKADRKKYIIAVCLVGLASGIVTSSVGSFHGFADGNYCWTHRGDRLERNFWRLNVASWTLFYDWMIVFYLSGIGVLIYGRRRLKSGLKLTLDSRLEMRRNSAISIMSYTGYWTIAFTWYAISFSARTHYEADGHMSPSKVFRSYSYTLAGRGVVDYFVWFMINKPSRMKAHWMKFTSESADQKFSAQLNTALQRELIFFTNEGMIRAVQLADEELMRKRERSPTQELVLAAAADNDTIDDAASARSSVVSFETPSDAPVMNLNHGASDRTLTMADLSSTSGEEELRSTGDSGRDSKKLKPSRRSFLTYLGFSAPSTHTSSQPPPGSLRSISQREAPINASAASSTSYTSEQSIKFTPYKSEAFAELRSACGIKTDDFMKSFEASTKPSISEGASGAFMFFSGDKKFIVKSMAEEECRFLIDIADAYVEYLITNPWSLITKFFGCFKITLYEKKFYFVVMENLFDVMEQGVTIHHRYDIKGSWVNRSYSRPRRGAKLKCRHCSMQFKYGGSKAHMRCPNVVGFHEPNVVLKDNDLRTRMRIGTEAGIELYEHLREDSLFLCSLGIMDYSLLLGVTDIEFIVDPPAAGTDDSLVADMQRRNTVTSNITLASTTSSSRGRPQNKPRAGSGNSTTSTMSSVVSGDGRGDRNHTTLTRESLAMLEEEVPSLERGNSNSTVGAIGAASAFRTHSHGHSSMSVSARGIVDHPDKDSSGHDATVLPPTLQTKHSMRKSERVFGPGYYYIGIIDILQQWNNQKRLERFWKVNVRRCDGNGLSAIDPVRYQRRFEAKLREIIAIPKDFTPRSPLPAILDSSRRGTGRYRARSSGAESAMRGSHGGGMVTGGGGVPDHRLSDDVEGHEDLVDLEQGMRKHPEQILMRVGSHQRRTRVTSPGAAARDSMHAV